MLISFLKKSHQWCESITVTPFIYSSTWLLRRKTKVSYFEICDLKVKNILMVKKWNFNVKQSK